MRAGAVVAYAATGLGGVLLAGPLVVQGPSALFTAVPWFGVILLAQSIPLHVRRRARKSPGEETLFGQVVPAPPAVDRGEEFPFEGESSLPPPIRLDPEDDLERIGKPGWSAPFSGPPIGDRTSVQEPAISLQEARARLRARRLALHRTQLQPVGRPVALAHRRALLGIEDLPLLGSVLASQVRSCVLKGPVVGQLEAGESIGPIHLDRCR